MAQDITRQIIYDFLHAHNKSRSVFDGMKNFGAHRNFQQAFVVSKDDKSHFEATRVSQQGFKGVRL